MKLFSLGRLVSAPPAKFGSPVAVLKWQKKIKTMLRITGSVWFTDGPRASFSRTTSRCCRRNVAEYYYIFWNRFENDEETTHFVKSSRDSYSLDEPSDSPSKSIHPVFRSNRPRTVQTNRLLSTRYQIVRRVSYPTTHPNLIAPRQLFFLGENLSNTIFAFDTIISPEPYQMEGRLPSSFHQHASLWRPNEIIWNWNAWEISFLDVSG